MNYAIFLSGGVGARTESDIPKQYVKAGGHMMASYAMAPLVESESIDYIYIVIDDEWIEPFMADIGNDDGEIAKIRSFARPGKTRQLSILNGLDDIISDPNNEITEDDTVLIVDAARPFMTSAIVRNCYEAMSGHDGVLPVLPMKDTIYLSDDKAHVTGLLDRSKLMAGQAPELYNLKKYYAANKALSNGQMMAINGACEPAVMAGMDIVIIPGDETNYKVTTEKDLMRFIESKEK